MDRKIQILDCTLRDGGLGLEDAALQQVSEQTFCSHTICKVIQELRESKIDIVELGSIEISQADKRNYAIYQNIEDISKMIPAQRSGGQLYAALYRGPDTPVEDIPFWRPGLCEVVRVIIRYSELQKSLGFCKALSEKGYKVFVQPMLTMRYTDNEIQMLIDAANDMDASALYFVDSYGYMQKSDIESLFHRYDAGLKHSIKVGFHAHNNMNLAFANVLALLAIETERDLVIDCCMLGMGQGAGNLQTELIIDHFNKNYGTAYDYAAVLRACEEIEPYWGEAAWGYSLPRLLPAIHKVAYKYATAFRHTYHLSYSEMDHIFRNIPEEFRHRYTRENATELLRRFGYDL